MKARILMIAALGLFAGQGLAQQGDPLMQLLQDTKNARAKE